MSFVSLPFPLLFLVTTERWKVTVFLSTIFQCRSLSDVKVIWSSFSLSQIVDSYKRRFILSLYLSLIFYIIVYECKDYDYCETCVRLVTFYLTDFGVIHETAMTYGRLFLSKDRRQVLVAYRVSPFLSTVHLLLYRRLDFTLCNISNQRSVSNCYVLSLTLSKFTRLPLCRIDSLLNFF